MAAAPSIAVALGGGGARGLAHIAVVEALDELGVTPAAISGTSMGAIVGAAWAAGMRGKDMRAHCLALTRDRSRLMAKILRARVGRLTDMLGGSGNPMLMDGERLLDLLWPEAVPDRFEQLQVPFTAIATDFYARRGVSFDSGPLAPAVAASMAIPGFVKGVEIGGRLMFDGGMCDPLPHRTLMNAGHFVIAVDVTGGPVEREGAGPSSFSALVGASQIMQGALTAALLETAPPDLVLRPDVDRFRLLDFLRVSEILAAADAVKDQVKRGMERGFTVSP